MDVGMTISYRWELHLSVSTESSCTMDRKSSLEVGPAVVWHAGTSQSLTWVMFHFTHPTELQYTSPSGVTGRWFKRGKSAQGYFRAKPSNTLEKLIPFLPGRGQGMVNVDCSFPEIQTRGVISYTACTTQPFTVCRPVAMHGRARRCRAMMGIPHIINNPGGTLITKGGEPTCSREK